MLSIKAMSNLSLVSVLSWDLHRRKTTWLPEYR